jgi:hypothetical protein
MNQKLFSLLGLLSFVFLLFACASSTPKRGPASDPSVYAHLLDNVHLAPQERWKNDSPDAESNGFIDDANEVTSASIKLAENGQPRSGRVFHDKSHGCLTGKIKILPLASRTDKAGRNTSAGKTAYALFTDPGTDDVQYDLIARFSNGLGTDNPDYMPDVRGLALKIFPGDQKPVDLLMTNASNPLGRDQAQFVEFLKATLKGNTQTLLFAKGEGDKAKLAENELPYFSHFLKSTFGKIDSVLLERYWSGHPYLLGPKQTMKFNVFPKEWSDDDQVRYDNRGKITFDDAATALISLGLNFIGKHGNYLREDLQTQVSNGPVKYILAVQLWQDPHSTPVENALVEWQETDAPSIRVAEITFDQQNMAVPTRQAECDALRFTPGDYMPYMRPAGNIGRGRIFTYLASELGRGASDSTPPNKSLVEHWRYESSRIQK